MTRGSLDQDAFVEVMQAGEIGACPDCLHDYAVACPGVRNPKCVAAWLSVHGAVCFDRAGSPHIRAAPAKPWTATTQAHVRCNCL